MNCNPHRNPAVDVGGHQHLRVHRAAFAQGDLAQLAEVTVRVGIGEEARLPIVSALDDVPRNTGKVESGLAWHDARDVEWGVQACCLEGQCLSGNPAYA